MSELNDINPKVTELTIGIKTPFTINIYPLSVGDELSSLDLISDGLKEVSNPDSSVGNVIVDAIRKNIPKFITLVTDEEEWKEECTDGTTILQNMTNKQLNRLLEIVYEENFGGDIEKNLRWLMGNLIMAAETLAKEKPSQPMPQPQNS